MFNSLIALDLSRNKISNEELNDYFKNSHHKDSIKELILCTIKDI